MKNLLKLEELAQFLVCLVALIASDVPWWTYLLLAFGPDIGMFGYLLGPRTGTVTYNLLHHKAIALLVAAAGGITTYLMLATESPESFEQVILLTGIVLYGHASMDRIFGYGLKFGDSFHHTHLGWIGKLKKKEE